MYELDRRGIPYSIPEDYCASTSIEAACVKAFERLRVAAERLDATLLAEDAFLREWGLRPFGLHLWPLAQCLDRLVARDLYLCAIRDVHRDTAVAIHRAPAHKCCTDELCPAALVGSWAKLLEKLNYGWRVELIDPPAPAESRAEAAGRANRSSSGLRKCFSDLLRRNPELWRIVALFRAGLPLHGWRLLLRHGGHGSQIVILGGAYDWPAALCSPAFDKFRVRCEERSEYFGGCLVSTSDVNGPAAERLWRELLSALEGRSYLALLREPVIQIACQAPAVIRAIVAAVRDRTTRSDIAAVVNAVSTDFVTRSVLRAYRSLGVPVLKWQHGSVWWRNRITQRMDIADLSEPHVLLAFGPGAKEAYEHNSHSCSCKVICAGSGNLDSLARKARGTRGVARVRKRLLYVITNYYCDQWYCGFSPPFSDNLYYRDQLVIGRGLKKLAASVSQPRITIKLPPNYHGDYEPPWSRELRRTRNIVLVGAERKYRCLLLENDAVIVDSPTTVLLEALSTEILVFVLTRALRWPDERIAELSRRAVCENDPHHLIQRLDAFVTRGEYPADRSDRAFVKQYGTYLDDGRSAERGARIVLDMAKLRVLSKGRPISEKAFDLPGIVEPL